jgi:hypothetical protein
LPAIRHVCLRLTNLAKVLFSLLIATRFKTGGRDLRCEIESQRCALARIDGCSARPISALPLAPKSRAEQLPLGSRGAASPRPRRASGDGCVGQGEDGQNFLVGK